MNSCVAGSALGLLLLVSDPERKTAFRWDGPSVPYPSSVAAVQPEEYLFQALQVDHVLELVAVDGKGIQVGQGVLPSQGCSIWGAHVCRYLFVVVVSGAHPASKLMQYETLHHRSRRMAVELEGAVDYGN